MGARATAACPKPDETKPDVAEGKPPQQLTRDKTSRIDWASLLKRVFQIDILACAKCGGRMKVLAVIDQPRRGDEDPRAPRDADGPRGHRPRAIAFGRRL